MEKYENIENKLDNKCEKSDVANLEMRIRILEDIMCKSDLDVSRLYQSDQELEWRMSTLETEVKTSSTARAVEKEGGCTDEELIKVAVQKEINCKSAEEKDIESRKCNITIYRAAEKQSDDVAQRRQDDETLAVICSMQCLTLRFKMVILSK